MDSQSRFSKFTTSSNDIVYKIMGYLDLDDLEYVSSTCKSLNTDSKQFCEKHKKEKMKKLITEHSCKNCNNLSYNNTKQVCNECYIHMCENCYTFRDHPFEFIKIPIDLDNPYMGYRKVCHDYCIYRCHKCKYYSDIHTMFLNDYVNLKTICSSCYVELPDEQKTQYDTITGIYDSGFDDIEYN